MAIPVLGEIKALLDEYGSSVVLKEHLALLNTKLSLLGEHIEKLEQENARVIERNTYLEQQLLRQEKSQEFVESRGALFEPNPGGGYSETPRCPVCHRSMWCFQSMFPYECSDEKCGHKANFKGSDLQSVIASLPPR